MVIFCDVFPSSLLISIFNWSISAFVYLSANWAYKVAVIIPAVFVSVLYAGNSSGLPVWFPNIEDIVTLSGTDWIWMDGIISVGLISSTPFKDGLLLIVE